MPTKPLIDRLPPSFKTPMAKFVGGSILVTGLVGGFWWAANGNDSKAKSQEISYTDFKKLIDEKKFSGVKAVKDSVTGQTTYIGLIAGQKQNVIAYDFPDKEIAAAIERSGGLAKADKIEGPSWWAGPLMFFVPTLLLIGFLVWQNRSNNKKQAEMMGSLGKKGEDRATTFGKSKARLQEDKTDRKITFKDVAGIDEAKSEVAEFVDFLKDPNKYKAMGARIPRGVLLSGPPGNGKTLLAKAIAGEANVPFFSVAGSDFVEMFVGVGAARVRDTFDQAKKVAPCIIFIDEIDSMGRGRGATGSNSETETTLNQMLVEMDGFEPYSGVIVMAATNRPDILDPALMRPKRFDRHVTINLPDRQGRYQILRVHAKGKPLAKDVRLTDIARETEGSSGADLENLLNEAALNAVRRNARQIHSSDIGFAIEKIALGSARGVAVNREEERCTARHEAGHAIVAYVKSRICGVKVNKVSVIPRGRALGVTWTVSDRDSPSKFRDNMEGHLAYLLGGRVAELISYNQMTTGASNDIERVTDTARMMVMVYGMAPDLPPRNYSPASSSGRVAPGTSERLKERVDDAIDKFIADAEKEAEKIIREHMVEYDLMTEALVKYKTLEKEDIECIMRYKTMEALDAVRKKRDEAFAAAAVAEAEAEVTVQPEAPPEKRDLWVASRGPS